MPRGASSGADRVVGKHVYGNLYDCPRDKLADEELLVRTVREAARIGRMRIWDLKSWKFGGNKGGVSVIALVVESHIALHTWVEYAYATLDVYSCGENADPEAAFNYIVSVLEPKDYTKHYADRSSRPISQATT